MNELSIGRIFKLTESDTRPVFAILAHLMSEVGELAEAVEHHAGFLPNKEMKEPLVGEVADVIQCVVSLFAKITCDLTPDERTILLNEALATKNIKWAEQLGVDTKVEAMALSHYLTGVDWPTPPKQPPIVNHPPVSGVAKRVAMVIAEQLGIGEHEVFMDSTIMSLGTDSLDDIEIIMGIEDEFGIELPDERVANLATVEQLVSLVKQVLKGPQEVPSDTETGRVYVSIRKHPAGIRQPVGLRRVYKMEIQKNGHLAVGIGKDGAEGWMLDPALPDPSFLTFRLNTETGEKVDSKTALEYWLRHNP